VAGDAPEYRKRDDEERYEKYTRIHEGNESKEIDDIERKVKEFVDELERRERTEEKVGKFIDELEQRERIEQRVKEFIDELEQREKSTKEQVEQEVPSDSGPKRWDPTSDEMDSYEKTIAEGYEKYGVSEEELKERWRERFVNDVVKELDDMHESGASFESKSESEQPQGDHSEPNEYAESGDGSVTSVVVKHQEEAQEQSEDGAEHETEEVSSGTESDSKEVKDESKTSEDAKPEEQKPETVTEESEKTDSSEPSSEIYTEKRTAPRTREPAESHEEENAEPAQEFKEQYEHRPTSTRFNETDRVPESWDRAVGEAERRIEHRASPAMTGGAPEACPVPVLEGVESADGYALQDSAGSQVQATQEAVESGSSEGIEGNQQHAESGSGDNPEGVQAETKATVERRETGELEEAAEKEQSAEQRLDELDRKIEQNPHLKRKNSAERYAEYETYKKVMRAPVEVSDSDLSKKYNVEVERVQEWREERVVPRLVVNAERHDLKREAHESEVPEEALGHRIDWSEVRDVVREIPDRERLSAEELTTVVEEIYRSAGAVEVGTVRYAELYEAGVPLGEDQLRALARGIRGCREEVERGLNERLGYAEDSEREVRVAVVDDRLYYWDKYAGKNSWLTVLAGEQLHLQNKEEIAELVDQLQKHLHIRGEKDVLDYYLNDVINQLSHLENPPRLRIMKSGNRSYTDGETLHFIGDMLEKTFDDMKPQIRAVGRNGIGQIKNPKWPEVRSWKMKTVAIAESDCSISEGGSLTYTEKNDERRMLGIQHFQEFGDIRAKVVPVSRVQEDTKRVRLSVIFGRAACFWGVPERDKAIRNLGLDESIRNETPENLILYIIEFVGEDGTFAARRFGITRASVLHAGDKEETYRELYGIEPKVTQDDIEFVISVSTKMRKNLCYEKGDRVRVLVSDIEMLTKSADTQIAKKAKRIWEIAHRERSKLLQDEIEYIIKPLGINMTPNPTYITFYKKSRRLSVEWIAKTSRKEDTIRWAILAPPNHPEKLMKVVKFLQEYKEKVKKVKREIIKDGLQPHPLWEEYDI
jgi:hypothetical protein